MSKIIGKFGKKNILIIAVNVLCIIIVIVCAAVSSSVKAPIHTGYAATAWAGESGEKFTQLEVFFPHERNIREDTIYNTRMEIEKALLGASIEDGDDRNYYTDAWSAEGTVSVTALHGAATVSAIGVGGDFFTFHPLRLRSGSYILPGDIMRDRVLLDEELAWRLFGSVNLEGMSVSIGNRPFIIGGVISRERGFAYDTAYDDGAGLFMSYEALGIVSESPVIITSYEVVLPDIVTGFARETLSSALGDDTLQIVDNSRRFSLGNLFRVIGAYGERSLRRDTVSYPYWENAMRYSEDWLALLLCISVAALIIPAYFAVFYCVKLVRFGYRKGKKKVRQILRKWEDRRYEEYLKRIKSQETEKVELDKEELAEKVELAEKAARANIQSI